MFNKSNLITLLLILSFPDSVAMKGNIDIINKPRNSFLRTTQEPAEEFLQAQVRFNWTGLPFDLRTRIMGYVFANLYRIVTGSEDGAIRIWDPIFGNQFQLLKGNSGPIRAIKIAPGNTIVSADNHTVRYWDIFTGTQLQSIQNLSVILADIAATTTSEKIIVSWGNHRTYSWNPKDNNSLKNLGLGELFYRLSLTQNNTIILANDDKCILWDSQNNTKIKEVQGRGYITTMAMMPNDTVILGVSNSLYAWNPYSDDQLALFAQTDCEVRSLAILAERNCIAAGLSNGTIHIFNYETRQLVQSFNNPSSWTRAYNPIDLAAIGKDTLVAGYNDGTVRIWDLVSGTIKQTLTTDFGPISALTVAHMDDTHSYPQFLYDNADRKESSGKLLQKITDPLKAYLMYHHLLKAKDKDKSVKAKTAEDYLYCKIVKDEHPALFKKVKLKQRFQSIDR